MKHIVMQRMVSVVLGIFTFLSACGTATDTESRLEGEGDIFTGDNLSGEWYRNEVRDDRVAIEHTAETLEITLEDQTKLTLFEKNSNTFTNRDKYKAIVYFPKNQDGTYNFDAEPEYISLVDPKGRRSKMYPNSKYSWQEKTLSGAHTLVATHTGGRDLNFWGHGPYGRIDLGLTHNDTQVQFHLHALYRETMDNWTEGSNYVALTSEKLCDKIIAARLGKDVADKFSKQLIDGSKDEHGDNPDTVRSKLAKGHSTFESAMANAFAVNRGAVELVFKDAEIYGVDLPIVKMTMFGHKHHDSLDGYTKTEFKYNFPVQVLCEDK